MSSFGALYVRMISHVHLGSLPFISTANISNSSSTHSSEQAILFLTQMKTPKPRACLSLLKVVKSALNISVFPISSLSHDSVPIIMSALYVLTKFQNSKVCCKYFCNLPLAKPVTCPHLRAPEPWFGFRPVPRPFSSCLHSRPSLFLHFLLPPPLPGAT